MNLVLMRKPAVFVSSTCYDLKQLRADLYAYLEIAGYDPVMSEYQTFPVDPDEVTVENCRRAVENKADIFVLVIGSRYGSTNEQGKSVTNLEYLTAKAKGIPIYTFAMRSIIDNLPVWHANPEADFTSVVDSSKLFAFVSEIRNLGEKWVFPFDTAQDIVSTLRTQVAYLITDALQLRMRAAREGLLNEKQKHLSGREFRLVLERPRGWEYLLFAEALLREIAVSVDLKRDWSYNVALGPERSASTSHFIQWIQEKNSEASRLASNLNGLFDNALSAALGPQGQPGDPQAIIYVANRIGAVYRSVLQWKLDFFCMSVDPQLLKLRSLASSLCDNVVAEFEEFAQELSTKLASALNAPAGSPPTTLSVVLKLTLPDQTNTAKELESISNLIASRELKWP